MLIVMKPEASAADIENVIRSVEALGYSGHTLEGSERTVVGITGNKGSIDPAHFENLPGVADTVRVTQPYRLATADPRDKYAVPVGSAFIGGGHFAMIAGPCALEDREQVFRTAKTVAESGAKFFRGGAFKPRTSPYAFQGLGIDGLKMLAAVREEFGLNIITEALDEHGIDAVVEYGDCVQIGARNMQNFSLLRYAGQCGKPVLLKRGLSATLDELLLAAEYILSEGNPNVILCERGIRTFASHARNTLDLSIVPAVQRMSHLPIIVDPSHGTGKNYMVPALSRAAVAVGADGLIIEVHPCPEDAMCDGAQALRPEQFLKLSTDIERIRDAVNSPAAESADASR
ncbi:MAG: 3-deoxy-7-phosphoheptulonate synthase [Acidobacteriota bacterium]|nr:MAG: 3-deoxy-7-phosphoheptulonate synthase [Acidobacteriota bacterium]